MAMDFCGNWASCIQTIIALDTIPPIITCAPDKTVECLSTSDVLTNFVTPTAFDYCTNIRSSFGTNCCTNVTITIVSTVIICVPAGPGTPGGTEFVRTWKATDCCGNMAFCSQRILRVCPPCMPGLTIQCFAFSPEDQDGSASDMHVTLPGDAELHQVIFSVRVCNTGDANLTNVQVRTPGLFTILGCTNPAPFYLAANTCTNLVLCTNFLSCSNSILAVSNINGLLILTSGHLILTNFAAGQIALNNTCSFNCTNSSVEAIPCEIIVECGMALGCRVTGGGRQENSVPPVRYVTHGGQVGAPVGSAGFDPGTFQREGSECIHGNWEVVRHLKGGDRGNFHAKIFDSLMCACLGCPENPGSGVVIGGMCNPDDRICGPEPRRAPANKICFSGIGDYTMDKGSRIPRSVLFRVDVEDRSEPGNNGKPSEDPPDRHRIRIWVLTTAELARLNNPSDRLLDFRRAISCSAGSTALQDGAVGANGLAVPLGTAVFGVRAPDVDDGGEMDHGNHQIHPMIKDCP
jgi:hypothetical protein